MDKDEILEKIALIKHNINEAKHFLYKNRREKYIYYSWLLSEHYDTINLIEGIIKYTLSNNDLKDIENDLYAINESIKEIINPIHITKDDFDEIINDIDNTTYEDGLYIPKEEFKPILKH